MDYDVEWVLQSVATCPRKSIKCMFFLWQHTDSLCHEGSGIWGMGGGFHRYEEIVAPGSAQVANPYKS